LGHVDTGKTKILDKLRRTNVQEGEAGGITQQIGATFFPIDNYKKHLTKIPEEYQVEPRVPGFLVIDTPGHESFQNLRTRGQSLCDLAVLVVDLMHGLQKQTLDSLDMLRKRKTPFVIAFNKIDRIHNWKAEEWGGFKAAYDRQKKNQIKEFDDRYKRICTHLIQTGLNVSLYYENPNMKEYLNIIPTSAVTGEGMPDLIGMFVYLSQKFLAKKLEFRNEIQCTILEVKVLEKTGTTIDVILVNGTMKIGDKIILGGLYGPIKTTIKILMTPHPMKEMRVKSEYEHHEEISGAIGIKIFANDLDNALAGSPCYVYKTEEEAEKYAKEITMDFNSVLSGFLSKNGKGILVQASTLGSLEAILTFLNEKKILIAAVGLGNLQKRDVTKIQIIHSKIDNPLKEHLTILAFDIKIIPEAQEVADSCSIKIFTADIIYHLFDNYIEYEKKCIEERKKDKLKEAVFPCRINIIPTAIFNRKDPIIIGVDVVEGILKVGTPLYQPEKKVNKIHKIFYFFIFFSFL
jgi:translation initiation factor 5B